MLLLTGCASESTLLDGDADGGVTESSTTQQPGGSQMVLADQTKADEASVDVLDRLETARESADDVPASGTEG